MKKSLFLGGLIFFLFLGSTLFCLTSAERALSKAYRNLGFSSGYAKVLCVQLNRAFKEAFVLRTLLETGVQPVAVAQLLAQGMLLDLSVQGEHKALTAASVFVFEFRKTSAKRISFLCKNIRIHPTPIPVRTNI